MSRTDSRPTIPVPPEPTLPATAPDTALDLARALDILTGGHRCGAGCKFCDRRSNG